MTRHAGLATLLLAILLIPACAKPVDYAAQSKQAHAEWANCTLNQAMQFHVDRMTPAEGARLAMLMCEKKRTAAIRAAALFARAPFDHAAAYYDLIQKDQEELLTLLATRSYTQEEREFLLHQEPLPLEFK